MGNGNSVVFIERITTCRKFMYFDILLTVPTKGNGFNFYSIAQIQFPTLPEI